MHDDHGWPNDNFCQLPTIICRMPLECGGHHIFNYIKTKGCNIGAAIAFAPHSIRSMAFNNNVVWHHLPELSGGQDKFGGLFEWSVS